MKNTRAERLSDTVVFQHLTVPTISHTDQIINAMTALVLYILVLLFLLNHGCVVECLSNNTRTSVNCQKVLTPARV